jgi:hypothetical protein
MATIILNQGEEITIEFAGSDGDITVAFEHTAITVNTDWPDTKGRHGEIYCEDLE